MQTLSEFHEEVFMVHLEINGKAYDVDVAPNVPLLWVIRERLRLTGTKFGCGIGVCGSCTVHIDGKAERSCQTAAGSAQGKKITTIEGIPENHPVKQAWIREQVPQCGYCQSGQIMAAAALIEINPSPTDADIDAAMSGNICRCGTYVRIRAAIKQASQSA